uniref:Variant surface glycoprotein (VSG), putative n=1 Tax=Trypanosoma brucei brucei (strain 927/4 GUTat10.1) TaxID=185431 RepID=Q4FKD2_TRYB2|nr:variant surface glycoprotein (VSG), putative [Trypanosoma brucei brucei TREU927]
MQSIVSRRWLRPDRQILKLSLCNLCCVIHLSSGNWIKSFTTLQSSTIRHQFVKPRKLLKEPSKQMFTQAVIALIGLVSIRTGKTEDVTPCGTNCACWARIEKQIGVYRGDYSAAEENIKENKKDFGKLIAAAVLGSASLRAKLAPVLLSAADVIETCETALAAACTAATAAELKVAELKTLYNVQHRLQTGTGGFNIEVKTDNFINAEEDLTKTDLGAIAQTGCSGALDTLDAPKIDKTNIDKEQPTPKLITHVHVEARCQRDGGSSNGCQATNNLQQNGKFEVKLIYDGSQTEAKSSWLANTATAQKISATPVDFIGNLNTEANTAIKGLKNTNPAPACTKKIRDYITIAENRNLNLMVTKALIGKTDAEAGQEAKDPELAAAITKYYGTGGTKFEEQLWKAIERTPAYIGDQKKEQATKIEKLETLTAVGEATARGLVKQIAAEAQAREPASTDDQSAEKQCSGKKGTECKGDCELVEEVCKPKKRGEGENKGKDGKTATTCTGKKQGECEKATGCKWEDNACKDSSILVNKKFALVVSALVALLF